jgi:PEP-CTERM motif
MLGSSLASGRPFHGSKDLSGSVAMMRGFETLMTRALCAVAVALVSSSASHAIPRTRTFDFTATDFTSLTSPSPPPPQNTVAGSVTLTFDPALTSSDEAAPDSIALVIAGHSYTRDEVTFEYFGPANVDKTFRIGVPALHIMNGLTNDFLLSFIYDPVADAPKFGYGLQYVTPAPGGTYISPYTTVILVPEPGTSALLAIGMAAMAMSWRPLRAPSRSHRRSSPDGSLD